MRRWRKREIPFFSLWIILPSLPGDLFTRTPPSSFLPVSPSTTNVRTARTPFGPRQRREGIAWRRNQPLFTNARGYGVDGKMQTCHEPKHERGEGDEDQQQQQQQQQQQHGRETCF